MVVDLAQEVLIKGTAEAEAEVEEVDEMKEIDEMVPKIKAVLIAVKKVIGKWKNVN